MNYPCFLGDISSLDLNPHRDFITHMPKGIKNKDKLSAPHLAGLGATEQQIDDFERIMATAVERILADQKKVLH